MSVKRKLKFEDEDLSSKALRLGLPDRWMYCPPMGRVVVDKFIPMKTPLDHAYNSLMEKKYWFHPANVFQSVAKNSGLKVGMWIDLTNTNRFYNKSEVERNGCLYKKMSMTGHRQSPTPEEIAEFIRVVDEFYKSHPNELIVMHCTHGFNRTGFLIVAYLVTVMDMGVDVAVEEFAKCRPYGIYKSDYLADLRERYGDEGDHLESAGRPAWENGPVSDEEYYFGMHPKAARLLNGVSMSASSAPPLAADPQPSSSSSNGVESVAVNGDSTSCSSGKKKPVFMDGLVPGVNYVEDAQTRSYLQERTRSFCKFNSKKAEFPGSQPVSLEKDKNMQLLAEQPYMVSWKADGKRYLVLIESRNQVYAFDRDNNVFLISGMTFLNRETGHHLRSTLVDAEMIIESVEGRAVPRLLIYDIVALENSIIGDSSFVTRFEAIQAEIIEPRRQAMMRGVIRRENEPISIRRKDFWEVQATYKLFKDSFSKNLGHEVDGLIFQPVNLPYTSGRCDQILKWKPAEKCTVDFKLRIVREQPPGELPIYVGHLYVQGDYNTPFAKIKATKALKPYDGKIIECWFNRAQNTWEFMLERTDKSHPNSRATAISVCNTIVNPLTKEELLWFIAERAVRYTQRE